LAAIFNELTSQWQYLSVFVFWKKAVINDVGEENMIMTPGGQWYSVGRYDVAGGNDAWRKQ